MNVTNLLQTAVFAGLSLMEPEDAFHPEPIGQIQEVRVEESSGLALSRQHPGLWWTHNDSGHTNHLFPMSETGEVLGPPVEIRGAVNIDWEDLAADDRGQIWISDLGNNRNRRRNLKVYVIDELVPVDGVFPESVPVKRVIRVRYPDQKAFPPQQRNFDSEGIFVRDQILYVLTKHRSDTDTKLYRLVDEGGEEEQVLEYIQTFPEMGMVTGAALHPEGRRLAVLTYTGVWLFETDGTTERFLSGKLSRILTAFRAWGQVEGIDWIDEETLLVSNEQRDLFRIPVRVLKPLPDPQKTRE